MKGRFVVATSRNARAKRGWREGAGVEWNLIWTDRFIHVSACTSTGHLCACVMLYRINKLMIYNHKCTPAEFVALPENLVFFFFFYRGKVRSLLIHFSIALNCSENWERNRLERRLWIVITALRKDLSAKWDNEISRSLSIHFSGISGYTSSHSTVRVYVRPRATTGDS